MLLLTLCDKTYIPRALTTLGDARRAGYKDEMCCICIDCELPPNELDVCTWQRPRIDTTQVETLIGEVPFKGGDGRQLDRTIQWSKIWTVAQFFTTWDTVVFVDAGTRLLHNPRLLGNAVLNRPGKWMAPVENDQHSSHFGSILLDPCRPELVAELARYGNLDRPYFNNSIYAYDTSILQRQKWEHQDVMTSLVQIMNRFPIFRSNEMGAMNVYFNLMHNLWEPLPAHLWAWNERGRNPSDFVAIKYPSHPDWSLGARP